MIRLLAMGGYIFQSAAAFALIFAVSHILRPEDYTAFSLALATSQFFAVAAFEWVNLAAVRYLASARGDDAARLCSSLFSAEALSATVLVFGAVAASCSGRVEPVSVLLGLAIAIMQSLTDLHFTMIRVSGRLGISALLFVARASTQLAGAVSGALFWGTPTAALLGVLLGHALGILLSSIMDHSLLQWSPSRTKRSELAEFCRYGMLAAGASVTHLTVPMMIRFIVIGGLGDSGAGAAAAGFSMALDLLQRPFTILVSAIHTVNYPEVVQHFDGGTEAAAKESTARLFEFIFCTTVIMLGGIMAFLPDAARLFVPSMLVSAFLAAAPGAATFYFLHTHLQATFAVLPHLQKSALRLIIVAACQLVVVSTLVAIITVTGTTVSKAFVAASVGTGVVMILASGPTLRFGAIPRWTLLLAATVGAIVIGALGVLPSENIPWFVSKIVFSGVVVLVIAYFGDFLQLEKRRPSRFHQRSEEFS